MNGGEALSTPAQSSSALLIARVASNARARSREPRARLAPDKWPGHRRHCAYCVTYVTSLLPRNRSSVIPRELPRVSKPLSSLACLACLSLFLSAFFPLCPCLGESLHACAIKLRGSRSACIEMFNHHYKNEFFKNKFLTINFCDIADKGRGNSLTRDNFVCCVYSIVLYSVSARTLLACVHVWVRHVHKRVYMYIYIFAHWICYVTIESTTIIIEWTNRTQLFLIKFPSLFHFSWRHVYERERLIFHFARSVIFLVMSPRASPASSILKIPRDISTTWSH